MQLKKKATIQKNNLKTQHNSQTSQKKKRAITVGGKSEKVVALTNQYQCNQTRGGD